MHARVTGNFRIVIVGIALFGVAVTASFAYWKIRHHPPKAKETVAFTAYSFTDSQEYTIGYRLLTPEHYTRDRRYPLLLFFHGSGERGDDNKKQIALIAPLVTDMNNRREFPCFVVVPQCPADEYWVHARYENERFIPSRKPSKPMHAVVELLGDLERQYPIDRSRLYVGGISMGGSATWDIIIRYPRRFAAAFPICGRADTAKADRLPHLPMRVFHGKKDTLVDVKWSRDMVSTIKRAGGHPVYTEYPDLGHSIGSRALGERYFLAWLFAQQR